MWILFFGKGKKKETKVCLKKVKHLVLFCIFGSKQSLLICSSSLELIFAPTFIILDFLKVFGLFVCFLNSFPCTCIQYSLYLLLSFLSFLSIFLIISSSCFLFYSSFSSIHGSKLPNAPLTKIALENHVMLHWVVSILPLCTIPIVISNLNNLFLP